MSVILWVLAGILLGDTAGAAESKGRDAGQLYADLCANCHGRSLEGGKGGSLRGGWKHGGDDAALARSIHDGYGGSGPFAMRRTTLVPSPYTLGAVETLKLDGTNFGLYSVNLEAGKRYQFLVDNPGQPLRVDLLDDEGEFLVSQGLNFGEVAVQYFTPKRSGRHRLWLRGNPGEWQFRLEPHVPPKVQ